ncbi:MAG: DUF2490 domain-containing protein [Bacteroidales bacterium]|nr:DUF2490 domain-containing protein [Bacteroidales bacterium]
MIDFRRFRYILPFCVLLFSLVPVEMAGQEIDFQTRWEAAIEKQVTDRIDVSLSLEQHFKNNSLSYDRSQATLIGQFDIVSGLDIRLGARYILVKNKDLRFENRYRLHLDLNYQRDIRQFELGFRLRTQAGFDDGTFSSGLMENKLVSRFRPQVTYHIFGTRFYPFAGIEPYLHLNHQDGPQFYRLRNYLGCNFKINFKNSLELSYLFDYELNEIPPEHASILWITYKFKF